MRVRGLRPPVRAGVRAVGLGLVALLAALWVACQGAGTVAAQEAQGPFGDGAGGAIAQLEIAAEQFFVVPAEAGAVRILQRTVVSNPGPRAARGVQVPVPAGARLLEPEEGWGSVQPGEGGLHDLQPLGPGEVREYRIVYELTMGSRPLALRRAVPYPLREVFFWVEEGYLALTGLRLRALGTESIGGTVFRIYGMEPSGPHEAWQVVVRPAPVRALPELSRGGERHGDPLGAVRGWLRPLPVAFALAAGLGSVALWRRRTGRSRSEGDSEWVREIVGLDVAYRLGELEEDVYLAKRRELLHRELARRREQTAAKRG